MMTGCWLFALVVAERVTNVPFKVQVQSAPPDTFEGHPKFLEVEPVGPDTPNNRPPNPTVSEKVDDKRMKKLHIDAGKLLQLVNEGKKAKSMRTALHRMSMLEQAVGKAGANLEADGKSESDAKWRDAYHVLSAYYNWIWHQKYWIEKNYKAMLDGMINDVRNMENLSRPKLAYYEKNDETVSASAETFSEKIDENAIQSSQEAVDATAETLVQEKELEEAMGDLITDMETTLEEKDQAAVLAETEAIDDFREMSEEIFETDTEQREDAMENMNELYEEANEENENIDAMYIDQAGEYKGVYNDALGSYKDAAKDQKRALRAQSKNRDFVEKNVLKTAEGAAMFRSEQSANEASALAFVKKLKDRIELKDKKELQSGKADMLSEMKDGRRAMDIHAREADKTQNEAAYVMSDSVRSSMADMEALFKQVNGKQERVATILKGDVDHSADVLGSVAEAGAADVANVEAGIHGFTNSIAETAKAFQTSADKVLSESDLDLTRIKRKVDADAVATTTDLSAKFGDESIRKTEESLRAGEQTQNAAQEVSGLISTNNELIAKNGKDIDSYKSIYKKISTDTEKAFEDVSGRISKSSDDTPKHVHDEEETALAKFEHGTEFLEKVAENLKDHTAKKVEEFGKLANGKEKIVEEDAKAALAKMKQGIKKAQDNSASIIKLFKYDTDKMKEDAVSGSVAANEADHLAGEIEKEENARLAKLAADQTAMFKELVNGITEKSSQTKSSLEGEIDGVKTQVGTDYDAYVTATTDKMRSMESVAESIKAGNKEQFLDKLSQQISLGKQEDKLQNQTLGKLKYNKETETALDAAIRKTTLLITDAERAEPTIQRNLQQQIKQEIVNSVDAEGKRELNEDKLAGAKLVANMDEEHTHEAANLKKDKDELKTFLDERSKKTLQDQKNATNLGIHLGSFENRANQSIAGDTEKLNQFEKLLPVLDQKRVAGEQEMEMHIEDQSNKLQEDVQSAVAGYKHEQMKSLGEMDIERAYLLRQEAERAHLQAGKMDRDEAAWKNSVDGKIAGIVAGAVEAGASLRGFEQMVGQSSSRMAGEAGELQSAVAMGEHKVDSAVKGEQERMTGALSGELEAVEGISGSFANAKNAAKEEIHGMGEKFKNQMAYFKGAGEAAVNDQNKQLAELDADAPDFVAEYLQGIAGSQRDLTRTKEHTDIILKSTEHSLAGSEKAVADLKKERDETMTGIHGSISEKKREAANLLEALTDGAYATDRVAQTEYATFDFRLKKMKQSIASVTTFGSNHDGGKLELMDNKLGSLQKSREKLLGWQKHFKHHTAAYRDEVKRQLKKLNVDLDAEVAQAQQDNLDENFWLNAEQRAAQRGVDHVATAAALKEAGQVSSLANGIVDQVGKAFGNTGGGEESDIERLKSQVAQTEENDGETVGAVDGGVIAVEEKSDAYRNDVLAGEGNLESKILLEKRGISPSNLRIDVDMDTFGQRLNKVSAASLLEIAEKEEVAKEFQSLSKAGQSLVSGVNQSDGEEAIALASLAKEMLRENAHLRTLDDKLDSRVERIERAVGV